MILRLGTWNIKAGRGFKGLQPDKHNTQYLNQIAMTIAEQKLHAIALQEVDVNTYRSGRVNQPLYLANKLDKLTGEKWRHLFGPAISFQGGMFGNAILASFPLEKVLNLSLGMPAQRVEKRTFLFARLNVRDDTSIGLGSFHLSVKDKMLRMQEVRKIKWALHALFPLPCFVLGGDLNGDRDDDAFRLMLEESFPMFDLGPNEGTSYISAASPSYEARIDFLFGFGVKRITAQIVDTGEISDHRLLWVKCEV